MTRKPLPPHGSLSRHKYHGCKCETCLAGYRHYARLRYRKQAYGTWQPTVDAEPVRRHLETLKDQGISYRMVAEHLGRCHTFITGFMYSLGPNRPRKKSVKPEHAALILAVRAEDVTPGFVDATGIRRRIQALVAAGWPMNAITHELALATPANHFTRQKYVHRSTAATVIAGYERLATEDPHAHGVSPGSSKKARNRAAREGWPDPLWWEDMGRIDDPAFDPASAEIDNARTRAAARRADIAHLAAFGIPEHDIAARLGMSADYVTTKLRQLRTAA